MSETNKPSVEQLAKFKQRANDMSLSEEVRAKFRAIVEKFEGAVEGEPAKPAKPAKATRKPRASKEKATTTPAKRGRKPAPTSEAKADAYEKAKADLKKKTGKTEEECEAIIDQYRELRAKAQTRKAKEEEASKDNKERLKKLENKGDLIEGTNEKTADAVIETTAKDVADKIEKEIEAIEDKAEKDAKAEVAKDKTLKTPQAKKDKVAEKVKEKVAQKTKPMIQRIVIDTSELLTAISNTLGKFDKDSKKEFLIKLRSDIDKLLSKFAFGGMTDGAVQPMNIQQSNLSASSVNPTLFANGGGVGGKRLFALVDNFDAKSQNYDQLYYKNDDYNKVINYIADLKNEGEYPKNAQLIEVMSNGKMRKFDSSMLANGGVVGQEIVFDDNGEENTGVIKDITNMGDYVVKADDGRTLLAQRDLDVISLGAIRSASTEAPRKRFGFFKDGGGVGSVSYDEVLDLLKEKLEDSVDDLPRHFEMSSEFKGEEVEHQSRDGFIAYTDGGYEVRWFEYLSMFWGAGYGLPTSALDNEKERQIDYSLEMAKDYFKDEYPEIVEELGEDNIDYNSLYEAGYEDEAEELSNAEQDNMDGTIMCEIGAYYYAPNNDRGIDGKHTLRLFGLVNLESPYHRSGNLEDRYDIDITFDSIEDLEQKIDEGLEAIIRWFDGDFYNESTEELRIRRMAKGGGVTDKLSYADFVETLRDNDKINAYTGKETRGMEMYYLPSGHPFLGLKFPHKNKRQAYNEYVNIGNKIGFDSGLNFLSMAQGGMTEHGLREGDRIIGDVDSEKDSIYIVDSKKRGHIVNLGEGKRYDKGGGVDGEITLYKVVGYIKASDFDDKKNGFVIADDYITKRQAEDTMYEWKRKKTYPYLEIKEYKGKDPYKKFAKGGDISSMLRNRRGK